MARAPEFLNFVPAGGKFDFSFILVIMFLGSTPSPADQGMIQRSFGSKNVQHAGGGDGADRDHPDPGQPFHFFSGLAAPI